MPAQFGLAEQATYSINGSEIEKGMKGKGKTRIDTIFANKAGATLVKACRLRWDLVVYDHVPIELELDKRRFEATEIIVDMQPAFPLSMAALAAEATGTQKPKEDENDNEEFLAVFKLYESKYKKTEEETNVEAMHRWWCRAAVEYIKKSRAPIKKGNTRTPTKGVTNLNVSKET